MNMFYLTVNNSQTLLHDVNTYSEFYYQLFEPLLATEDWEVTLHFKMSVPKNLNLNIFDCLNNDKRIRHKFFQLSINFSIYIQYTIYNMISIIITLFL